MKTYRKAQPIVDLILLVSLMVGHTFAQDRVVPAVPIAQKTEVETRNQEIVRRFFDAINRGDSEAAAAEFAEDARNFGHSVGRTGIRDRLVDIFTTFPDWKMEILQIVASGDVVVVRSRVNGTHRGVNKMALNGLPVGTAPTGKRFEVTHMHWLTFRDGKIIEHYANRDDLGMLRQLGLLPPITPTATPDHTR